MQKQHLQLIARLEASAVEVAVASKSVTAAQLKRVPREGEWSLHQALSHLRDTEVQVFAYRAARILKETEPPLVANFDQEEWMREHYVENEPLKKIVAEFRAARRKLVKLLRNIKDKDWTRYAIHPEYGKISLEYIALHAYNHTLEHLRQLLDAQEENVLNAANGRLL
ncbi:MAG: DinB family protein [Chloroflexi bacterium]|nr:DinB family protein [Chloroflexota bacterium]